MQKTFIVCTLILALLASYASAESVIGPNLEKMLQTSTRGGEQISVIVTLKDEIVGENIRGGKEEILSVMQSQADASQTFLNSLCQQMEGSGRIQDVSRLTLANVIFFTGDADAIREFAAQSDVQSIVFNEVQQMINPIAAEEARSLWGLTHIRSKQANQQGLKGQGVTVAVVDTGIDSDHSAFSAGQVKVNLGKSFVPSEATAEDGNGHGTHCAGTIGGHTYGVAPAVSLIGVKVLSAGGSGSWQSVAQGVEYAAQHADVISMSLGGTASANGNVVEGVVKNAINAGVIVVIAAGNSGPWPRTIGTPGVVEQALTIGAIDSNGNLASFSSRGPSVYGHQKPEVVAPGVGVLSAWKNGGTNTISGTSMACPHVAGLCALYLSKHKGAKQSEIKSKLMNTAFGKKAANEYGSGTVDCVAATN